MRRPRLLDVDAKYGAAKPLLDILQPPHAFRRSVIGGHHKDSAPGLGLIDNDTDGEGREAGCVTSFRVTQDVGPAAVWLTVSES
jgi:hypothetical protein